MPLARPCHGPRDYFRLIMNSPFLSMRTSHAKAATAANIALFQKRNRIIISSENLRWVYTYNCKMLCEHPAILGCFAASVPSAPLPPKFPFFLRHCMSDWQIMTQNASSYTKKKKKNENLKRKIIHGYKN